MHWVEGEPVWGGGVSVCGRKVPLSVCVCVCARVCVCEVCWGGGCHCVERGGER